MLRLAARAKARGVDAVDAEQSLLRRGCAKNVAADEEDSATPGVASGLGAPSSRRDEPAAQAEAPPPGEAVLLDSVMTTVISMCVS